MVESDWSACRNCSRSVSPGARRCAPGDLPFKLPTPCPVRGQRAEHAPRPSRIGPALSVVPLHYFVPGTSPADLERVASGDIDRLRAVEVVVIQDIARICAAQSREIALVHDATAVA